MSGYDETNPEAYRPTEPEAAADRCRLLVRQQPGQPGNGGLR